jgi:hypothetical protein
VQLVSGPVHGSLELHADGSFVYRPEANYFGADIFSYRSVETGERLRMSPLFVYPSFRSTTPPPSRRRQCHSFALATSTDSIRSSVPATSRLVR